MEVVVISAQFHASVNGNINLPVFQLCACCFDSSAVLFCFVLFLLIAWSLGHDIVIGPINRSEAHNHGSVK